jgi:hypothetical protein
VLPSFTGNHIANLLDEHDLAHLEKDYSHEILAVHQEVVSK